jgi:hypothetical protein
LSGLVVAFVRAHEANTVSFIAGIVRRLVSTPFLLIALITAIAGGCPGMISATSAATAVLAANQARPSMAGLQVETAIKRESRSWHCSAASPPGVLMLPSWAPVAIHGSAT